MQIWLQHLQTVVENRCRGAHKAAATRQAKKALEASHTVEEGPKGDNECFCGDCGCAYPDETDEPGLDCVGCANNGTMPSVRSLYACPKQRKFIFVSNVNDDCNNITCNNMTLSQSFSKS